MSGPRKIQSRQPEASQVEVSGEATSPETEKSEAADHGTVWGGRALGGIFIPTVTHDGGGLFDVNGYYGLRFYDSILNLGAFYRYAAITPESGSGSELENSFHAGGLKISRTASAKSGLNVMGSGRVGDRTSQLGFGRMGFGYEGEEVGSEFGLFFSNTTSFGYALPLSATACLVPSVGFMSDFFYPFASEYDLEDYSGSFRHLAVTFSIDLMFSSDVDESMLVPKFSALDSWHYFIGLANKNIIRGLTYDLYGKPTLSFGDSDEPNQLTEERGILLSVNRVMAEPAEIGDPINFYFLARGSDPVIAQLAKYQLLASALGYGVWGATNLGSDETKGAANLLIASASNDLNAFAGILIEEHLDAGQAGRVALRMLVAGALQLVASAGKIDGGAGVAGVAMTADPRGDNLIKESGVLYSPYSYYVDTKGRSGGRGIVKYRQRLDDIFSTEVTVKSPAIGPAGMGARGRNIAGEEGVEYPLDVPSSVGGGLTAKKTLLGDESGIHFDVNATLSVDQLTDSEGGANLGLGGSASVTFPLGKGVSFVIEGGASGSVNVPSGNISADLEGGLGFYWFN